MFQRPSAASTTLRATLSALVLALLAVVVTAGPSIAAARSGTPAGQAWVRVAHLVPGFGAARIDLLPTNGTGASSIEMAPEAAYGDVTKYRQFTPGSYQVQVRLATAGSASAPMLSRTLTITANKAYSLAILGSAQAPRLAALSDDLTPPTAGNARVRVLAASSQDPQVSVVAKNGPTIAENAVLGQATGYAQVPAGTWKLQTTAGQGATVNSSIKVASGSVYTLLVLNGTGGPRLDLITDAAGTSAAPEGGAQTGGGGTATEFVGTAPSHRPALLVPSLLIAVLAGAGTVLLVGRRRSARS